MGNKHNVIPQPRTGNEVYQTPVAEVGVSNQFDDIDPAAFLKSIGGNIGCGEQAKGRQLLMMLLEATGAISSSHTIDTKERYVAALTELRGNPKAITTVRFKGKYGDIGSLPGTITDEMIIEAEQEVQLALLERTTVANDLEVAQQEYDANYIKIGGDNQPRVDIEKNTALLAETKTLAQTDPLLQFTRKLTDQAKSAQEKTYALTLDRFARFMAKKAHVDGREMAIQ